ncbi:hypothetical protein FQN54_003159 [Arachnomyces sp. PD_36]|nr:hypothetical protein FQN54_003159 [Arachnomyces sp. PD_36]
MAVAPKFAGQKWPAKGLSQTPHTLELYLDYVCPFSAKLFNTIYTTLLPHIKTHYPTTLQLILRQQIQPWHPSSTLTHEAAAAVLRLSPDKYWAFSAALFAAQTEYFDVNVVNETRNETYKRLAKLAGSVGVDEGEVLGLLRISDKPAADGGLNTGNGVTNDIKLLTRANRLIGNHVTPTVYFNGIEERSISSSFTGEQWEEWLKKNIV